MRSFTFLSFIFPSLALVAAQNTVTVYQPKDQVIFGGTALHLTATATAAAANFTGAAAYDQTVLNPPAVPNPAIPSQLPIQLPSSGGLSNLSIPQNGAFMGISIEMSVANQVCESACHLSLSILTNNLPQWARTGTQLFTCHHSGHLHTSLQQFINTGRIPQSYDKPD